jgi:hypothetical protein
MIGPERKAVLATEGAGAATKRSQPVLYRGGRVPAGNWQRPYPEARGRLAQAGERS